MAYEIGTAYVTVMPSARGFASSLGSQLDGPFLAAGQRGGSTIATGVGQTGRRGFLAAGGALGAAFAGAFAVAGAADIARAVTGFLSDAVASASDLSESQSKTTQIFGESTDAVLEFARTAASRLGQTEQQALDGAATFGIFGQAAGLAGDDLSTFSTDLLTLATDLASFNNTNVDDAITAIGAAMRGEAEPIRQYGVLLDDATLKARAMAMGIYEGTAALTPQQRVLAAQAEILAQTTTQQGDFIRTQDGMANRQRILQAEFENTKTAIGTALLPAINDLLGVFMDVGVPVLQDMVAWITQNKDAITAFVLAVADGALAFAQGLAGYMEHMARMTDFWLTWTTNLAQTFLNVVELVVDGAAQMFGWLPGVGARLTEAQEKFDAFRDEVDRTFAGMREAADQTTRMYQGVQDSIAGIRTRIAELDGATATFFINAQGNGVRVMEDGSFRVDGSTLVGRAGGGDVRAGQPYVVGEREAELFVPNVSGRIYNQNQLASLMGSNDGSPVVQNIYPSAGMSEQEVGDAAGSALAWQMRGAGRGTR